MLCGEKLKSYSRYGFRTNWFETDIPKPNQYYTIRYSILLFSNVYTTTGLVPLHTLVLYMIIVFIFKIKRLYMRKSLITIDHLNIYLFFCMKNGYISLIVKWTIMLTHYLKWKNIREKLKKKLSVFLTTN